MHIHTFRAAFYVLSYDFSEPISRYKIISEPISIHKIISEHISMPKIRELFLLSTQIQLKMAATRSGSQLTYGCYNNGSRQ